MISKAKREKRKPKYIVTCYHHSLNNISKNLKLWHIQVIQIEGQNRVYIILILGQFVIKVVNSCAKPMIDPLSQTLCASLWECMRPKPRTISSRVKKVAIINTHFRNTLKFKKKSWAEYHMMLNIFLSKAENVRLLSQCQINILSAIEVGDEV